MAETSSALPIRPPVLAHPPRRRLEELDGLRGILALFVVVYHLREPLGVISGPLTRALPIVGEGWFAVDVFFVMSGFVMAYVYGSTFARKVTWAEYRAFFVARIARLYPVHLAAMLVLAIVFVPRLYGTPEVMDEAGRFSWQSGLASLLMLHSPWIDHRSWNFPSWSISAEWHAYVLFPFLVGPVLRRKAMWLTILVALCVGGVFALYWADLPPDRYPTNGLVVLARVLPLFLAGMALYPLHQTFGERFAHPALALMLAGLVLALLNVPDLAPVVVFLIPLLTLAVLNAPVLQGPLSSAPARFLGSISYSLYMTHALVMLLGYPLVWYGARLFWSEAAAHASAPFQWGVLASSILTSIVLGTLVWRFIEVPARSRVARLLAPGGPAREARSARA
ncbi:acyltransferase family protein [Aureimonas sp. D3]|uniref:acyltransferase family protein n=1 Tax=Aureimonas sp. D3 TaxID=1638164 RepID=UPI0007818C01|nr:acyltransferase [Aureimonas sp. D3]